MSDMIEVKTADLIGPALDWATAHACKAWEFAHEWFPTMTLDPTFSGVSDDARGYGGKVVLIPRNAMRQDPQEFSPSTDWSQGGPLIDKLITAINQAGTEIWWSHCGNHIGTGSTPLIACCRAIIACKLGDAIKVPSELLQ